MAEDTPKTTSTSPTSPTPPANKPSFPPPPIKKEVKEEADKVDKVDKVEVMDKNVETKVEEKVLQEDEKGTVVEKVITETTTIPPTITEQNIPLPDSSLSEVSDEALDKTPKPTSSTAGAVGAVGAAEIGFSPQKVVMVIDRDTKVEAEVLPEEGKEWNGVDGSIHLRAYIGGMNRDFWNVRYDAGGKEPGTYHIVEKKVKASSASLGA